MKLIRRREALGTHRTELTTPSLLLDLDVVDRNIATMASAAAALGVGVRPHVKAHKCVQLAQRQVDGGSIGLTCATAAELEAMTATSADELLLANEIIDPRKLDRIAVVARDRAVALAVDDEEHVELAATAARRAGAVMGIVVEVDIGMRRAGVRSSGAAARLAEAVTKRTELSFRGLHAYEGHCVMIGDAGERIAAVHDAVECLAEAASAVVDAVGSCDLVTLGGTATFATAGAHRCVTDVQAGSYVLMDSFHQRLVPDLFEPALTVLATAVSVHGRTAVLDTGRKSVSTDLAAPEFRGSEVRSAQFHEEHCVIETGSIRLLLGDRLEIVPGYTPTTVQLHDKIHVVRDDIVVDVWPVAAR